MFLPDSNSIGPSLYSTVCTQVTAQSSSQYTGWVGCGYTQNLERTKRPYYYRTLFAVKAVRGQNASPLLYTRYLRRRQGSRFVAPISVVFGVVSRGSVARAERDADVRARRRTGREEI